MKEKKASWVWKGDVKENQKGFAKGREENKMKQRRI